MKNVIPLDDLEMHELLRLIYPEHIRSDADEYFDLSAEVAGESMVCLGDGIEVPLAELLARVCTLTMPMQSPLSKTWTHALGRLTRKGDEMLMIAAVRRECKIKESQA
jgi:hypothetical protein